MYNIWIITSLSLVKGPVTQALWNKEKPVIEFSNSSLNGSNDEVVLNAGDSLNVTCYSSLPPEWVVVQGNDIFGPDFAKSVYLTDIEVIHFQDVNANKYASVLFIENIAFDYTGLYVCRLAQDSGVKNSVYIFAADYDNPFTDRNYVDLPYYPNHLVLYMDRPYTVPCQTSSPYINVTFRCKCVDPKPLGPEQGIVFDPKRGIQIEKVNHSLGGLYVCETTIGNVTYIRMFTLVIHVSLDSPPYLKPDDDILRTVGESFSISCYVQVFKDVRPVFRWRYKTKEKTKTELQNSPRVSIMKPYKTTDRDAVGPQVFRADIEVHNATFNDSGIYICERWISDTTKDSVELHVQIHSAAIVLLDTSYLATVGDDVTLPWMYDRETDMLKVFWIYKDPSEKLTTNIMSQIQGSAAAPVSGYNVEHNGNGKITLKSVTKSDTGIYYCEVTYSLSSGHAPVTGTATVTVLGLTSSAEVDVNEDHTVTLKCPQNGIGQFPKWTGPEGPMTEGQTTSIMEQGIEWVNDKDIKIEHAQLKHGGSYTCDDGKGRTGTIELDVQYFSASARYSDASAENTTTVLTCTVHSNPSSRIELHTLPGQNDKADPIIKFHPCRPDPNYENRTSCSVTAAIDVSKEDNGVEKISCEFIYKNQSKLTWTPKVSFVFPPTMVNISRKPSIDGDVKLTLTCSIDASSPVSSLVWREGTSMMATQNTVIRSSYERIVMDTEYNGKNITQDIDIPVKNAHGKVFCCARHRNREYCNSTTLGSLVGSAGCAVAKWTTTLFIVCAIFFSV